MKKKKIKKKVHEEEDADAVDFLDEFIDQNAESHSKDPRNRNFLDNIIDLDDQQEINSTAVDGETLEV